jgi:uncharacterized protein YndB with AHSA1/START domain
MASLTATRTQFVVEPGKQNVVIKRVFSGSRDRVFKLVSNPKLIPRWWGPRELRTKVDRMDFHRGGSWRYVQRDAQGKEYAFHGVYHDVVSPERYVNTSEFEGMPGHVTLETTTFKEIDGRTEMTTIVVFPSVEDRDRMVATGMERGVRESVDRFEELVVHER